MILTTIERMLLHDLLPKEGDFITLKLVRKLRESLAFSEKEIAEIGFKSHWKCPQCEKVELSQEETKCPDCGIYMRTTREVTFDNDKAKYGTKDVFMGGKMLALCESTLKKLSDEKKLTEQHMSLYQKFVEGAEEEVE